VSGALSFGLGGLIEIGPGGSTLKAVLNDEALLPETDALSAALLPVGSVCFCFLGGFVRLAIRVLLGN
jgi:hypothetical protein